MIGATLKSWHSRAMHEVAEGVGDTLGCHEHKCWVPIIPICSSIIIGCVILLIYLRIKHEKEADVSTASSVEMQPCENEAIVGCKGSTAHLNLLSLSEAQERFGSGQHP